MSAQQIYKYIISNPRQKVSPLYFQHRDTPENNADTPFSFTADNLKVFNR